MSRAWGALPLTALAIAAAGCGGDQASRTVRADSAGVEIVTSPGTDVPLPWSFTERFTLGGEDEGPEAFYAVYPGDVATDRDGRIFVLDRDGHRVEAFDAQGAYLWSAGREGSGPGELKMPIAVFASPGGVVSVVDGPGMKIVRFADAGYQDEARVAAPPWQSRFAVVSGGLVIDARPVLLSEEPRERLLLVAAADTVELVSVPLEQGGLLHFTDCPIGLRMPPVFGPDIAWAARDSVVVAAWMPSSYEIAVFELGELKRSYRRELSPVPATAQLAAAEMPEGLTLSAGPDAKCDIDAVEAVEQRGYGPFVPAVRALAITWDGSVWVQRSREADHRADFDVLAADGAYVGTLHAAPVPVAFLPDGGVVGIEQDELDVRRVAVYDVERPSH